VAMNFAFEEEAETFLHVAMTTVASRNRRREGKLSRFINNHRFRHSRFGHDDWKC